MVMHHEIIDFGSVRALAQRPRSPERDLALCELLRDTPRRALERAGLLDYVLFALSASHELRLNRARPARLIEGLRCGELVGAASDLCVDLRGYRRPTQAVFNQVIEASRRWPIAHLILDETVCMEEWLVLLLLMGDWTHLKWLSARRCGLRGDLARLFDALPSCLVGLSLADNALDESILSSLAASVSGELAWLNLSGLQTSSSSEEGGAWSHFVRALSTRQIALKGLVVDRCKGFDDDTLVTGEDLFKELIELSCVQSGVSEHSLMRFLSSLPEGQLERLGCGEGGDEPERFIDEEALMSLFMLPSLQRLDHVHFCFSTHAIALAHHPLYHVTDVLREIGLALGGLEEGLKSLTVQGLSLSEIDLLDIETHAESMHALGLLDLAPEERRPGRPGRHDDAPTLTVERMTLGFMPPSKRVEWRDLELYDLAITRMIESILSRVDHRHLQALAYSGATGLAQWVEVLQTLHFEALERVHVLDPKNEYDRSGGSWVLRQLMRNASWLRDVRRVELPVKQWTMASASALMSEPLHPDFVQTLQGSALRASHAH